MRLLVARKFELGLPLNQYTSIIWYGQPASHGRTITDCIICAFVLVHKFCAGTNNIAYSYLWHLLRMHVFFLGLNLHILVFLLRKHIINYIIYIRTCTRTPKKKKSTCTRATTNCYSPCVIYDGLKIVGQCLGQH